MRGMLTFVELMTATEYPKYIYILFSLYIELLACRRPTKMPTPNWLFIRKLNSHNERPAENQFIHIKFIFILPQCERTTF